MEFALGIQKVVETKITTIEDIGDLRNLQIDSTMFNKEFDFIPKYSYQETIVKVSNWLKLNLERVEKNNFAELLNMPISNWEKLCK